MSGKHKVHTQGGNFCELVESKIFMETNFREILTGAAKRCHPPNFMEKTFVNSHKTLKFAKVFSLESFPLYSTQYLITGMCFSLQLLRGTQSMSPSLPAEDQMGRFSSGWSGK